MHYYSFFTVNKTLSLFAISQSAQFFLANGYLFCVHFLFLKTTLFTAVYCKVVSFNLTHSVCISAAI